MDIAGIASAELLSSVHGDEAGLLQVLPLELKTGETALVSAHVEDD